jgi:hypothetical protein
MLLRVLSRLLTILRVTAFLLGSSWVSSQMMIRQALSGRSVALHPPIALHGKRVGAGGAKGRQRG